MAAIQADFLVEKIISVIENEASLLGSARDELDEVKRELVSMRAFLEDADMRSNQTEGEKAWVAGVRDLMYDVEDVIDEFMYHTVKRQGRHKGSRIFLKTIAFPKILWEKHQIASRLQRIKAVIKTIPERNQRYGVDRIVGNSSSSLSYNRMVDGESSLFIEDDELVGIEDERELLVGLLTNGEKPRGTISVVGMGGSGKTTLVAKAYSCQNLKHHFECYAWLTVSRTYVIEDLLRSLIKEFCKENVPAELSSMNYRQLVEMLVCYLESKSYLVVLDDVWCPSLWSQLKVSLPNNFCGSRVMLTTRNEDVASLFCEVESHIHHIRALPENKAWDLFCAKAFSRNGNRCPDELENLAHEIVEKCQGLPLAIVSLGSLLSTKSSESEWRLAYNNLNRELKNNGMYHNSILLLSYNDLPYNLKNCFLYCCLFPEDYKIKRKRLIRLWMAEGFVEHVRGATPEQVAEGYLLQLVRRSMLQVVERNLFGLPKACKMHDMLRELALSIAEKEKFCSVYDDRKGGQYDGISRRLSIQANGKDDKLNQPMSQLRSFFTFSSDMLFASFDRLVSGFKLLRVLDLQDARIEKLPNDVVTLFNLRYLNLRGTLVKELPKSIGRLCNLETLYINDTKIQALPKGIVKLQNLRYLLARRINWGQIEEFDFISGIKVPSGICTLKNLQVLGCVEANGDLITRLANMTQLVKLELSNVKPSDERDLCSAIQNMPLLCNLFVMGRYGEILELNALESPPPNLSVVTLYGKLERIPEWFHSLQNLRDLWLRWSGLVEDPIPELQGLPNLRRLGLVKAFEGEYLYFPEGFDRLEILNLLNFPALRRIHIEKGAMSGLKKLYIGNCPDLEMIPGGVIHLNHLRKLNLMGVPEEVVESIRAPSGVDFPSVHHIAEVDCLDLAEFTNWIENAE
ncbi:Disease resistance protein RPM1 [Euphorbia peplus]|nr:Disease resistance protein RPM1 [Euphorbia peplus]